MPRRALGIRERLERLSLLEENQFHMELPFVSIIIPVYEATKALEECVESLAALDYPKERFEVLIVFNGPHPSKWKPCGKFQQLNFQVLHEPKPGSYSARNYGMSHARGTVFAFTDSDCRPEPKWLIEGVAPLIKNAADITAGLVTVTTRNDGANSAVVLHEKLYTFRQSLFVSLGFGVTANLFTTKRVMDLVGPFDSRLYSGGDLNWGLRAKQKGFHLTFISEAVVKHDALENWWNVLSKNRRIAGGHVLIRKFYPGIGVPQRVFPKPKDFLFPKRPFLHIFRQPSLGSPFKRFCIFIFTESVILAHLIERLLVRLGKRPLRF